MHRLITLVLMDFLVMSGWALAADEQNTQELTANGLRTMQPFTVKDHCEVRWTSTNDLSLFLLDAQGGRSRSWGIRLAMCPTRCIMLTAAPILFL
ncbi:hypothetical protein ACYX34_02095 [Nitrospira sp. CMX1]